MSAQLFTVPYQCVVVAGLAVPGATLTFYQTGTSTKLPVYTTSALTTQASNPVLANSAGHIPLTYLDGTKTYRVVIKNKAGTVLDDVDPYVPGVTTLGITFTSAAGSTVSSRGALAAILSPTANQSAILAESGYEGTFVFDAANHATHVTNDPKQTDYVAPSSDTTGASGAWVRKSFGLVVEDIEVTVGTAGTFTTLNQAITHLSAYRARYKAQGISGTIRILNDGWTMAEQVIVTNGVDLAWIKIVSNQAVTTIARSAITVVNTSISGMEGLAATKAAFMGGRNSSLPVIACVFNMDTSGAASGQCGIFLTHGAKGYVAPGCGINGTNGSGVDVVSGGHFIGPSSVWDHNAQAGVGANQHCAIRSRWQGTISATECTITNSGDKGVMVIGGSTASIRGSTISNCAGDGVLTGGSSVVHLREVAVSAAGGHGFYISEGSCARLLGSSATGCGQSGLNVDQCARVTAIVGCSFTNNGSYGVRAKERSAVMLSAATITGNTVGGAYANGGDIYINGTTCSGHPAATDLQADTGGSIYLGGSLTTTSGSSSANNVTDSNVAAFNTWRQSDGSGIFGRGGKASNRGTATIASGTTSKTVTHGVDFTPVIQEVSCTPTNLPTNMPGWFWVSNVTSTTFDINVDINPGSGGATFGWSVRRAIG